MESKTSACVHKIVGAFGIAVFAGIVLITVAWSLGRGAVVTTHTGGIEGTLTRSSKEGVALDWLHQLWEAPVYYKLDLPHGSRLYDGIYEVTSRCGKSYFVKEGGGTGFAARRDFWTSLWILRPTVATPADPCP